jgi:DedD protein
MDFLLKQRLVGAIVLVALGVIFIPMLLEGPDSTLVPDMEPLPEPDGQDFGRSFDTSRRAADRPAEPELALVQAEVASEPVEGAAPVEATVEPQSLALPEDAGASGPEPEEPAVAAPAAPPVVPAPPQPKVSEPAAPAALGNWVVQMASLSDEQRALQLRDKLRAAGYACQVQQAKVAGKTHYRVRVGPYLERADAERDRDKLAAAIKLEGRVLSNP